MNERSTLPTVLIVSGSSVLREVLRLILRMHADQVVTAGDYKSACHELRSNPEIDVVLTETVLPDGNGFAVLHLVAGLRGRVPRVILIGPSAHADEMYRAHELGAAGFLVKPISLHDVTRVLATSASAELTPRGRRRRPGGRALLLDGPASAEGAARWDSHLVWFVRDLSVSGAFLETEAPLPIGTHLELALELGREVVTVSAEVVRVQEPGWGRSAGTAVAFVDLSETARSRLESWVSQPDDRRS